MGIRLLIADDHRMVREGLKRALTDHGFDVVGEAGDGDEVVRLTRDIVPELVLMDLSMPGIGGIEACRQIVSSVPRVKVVMLTMHADADTFAETMQAGAKGYLVKANSLSELATALRLAAAGETVIAPQMKSVMLGEARRMREMKGASTINGIHKDVGRLITKREEEVLQLIADGCSTPEVAAQLYISQKTVKNHLASIYQKLDARDRTQAVLTAVRLGIVTLN